MPHKGVPLNESLRDNLLCELDNKLRELPDGTVVFGINLVYEVDGGLNLGHMTVATEIKARDLTR